jgi:hypothetical protein
VIRRRTRVTLGATGGIAAAAVVAVTVAALGAAAAPSPGATPGAPASPAARGVGSDPLTATESQPVRAKAAAVASVAGGQGVTGAAGAEFLTAQIRTGDSTRRADVYYYDYATNSLIKVVVDVATGAVVKTYSATGMQLPATDAEVADGLRLLLASPLSAGLRSGYATATGKPLTGPAELLAKAHTYQAEHAGQPAAQCGQHRCLQLSVQTTTGTYIDVNDLIVDLSARTVVRIGGHHD